MLDKSKIGMVCLSPRAVRETQITALKAAGAQWIVELGRVTPSSWRDIAKIVRPDDVVFIYALALVPTKRGEDDLPPSAQVSEFVMEVHERGGTVVEALTGRNSKDRKQRREMIGDALKAIRRGSRQPPTTRKRGRPRKEFTAEQMAKAKAAWQSPDYVTNEAAARHFPQGFTARRAWELWGPSGRLGKVKKKRKS
jgi:hypothetical protein